MAISDFEKAFEGLAALINSLEVRVKFSKGHSRAVTSLSLRIGKALGLSAAKMKSLQLAARLHDIGKIALRDEILLKPDSLTPEEMQEVRRHPEMGVHLLRPFSLGPDIIPAIVQHHERYDGSGYPAGLEANSISPLARIIAVSDTYDALTHQRPYRKPFQHHEAVRIILGESGKTLCPDCVAAFKAMVERAPVSQESFREQKTVPPIKAEEVPDVPLMQSKTVVIADNNRLFFKDAARELKKCGVKDVVYAKDGECAWDLINDKGADLLICDWDIVGMNCRQLLEKMAWSEEFSQIDTIITARDVGRGQIGKIVEVGPSAILIKPFSLKSMTARIKVLFKERLKPVEKKEPDSAIPSDFGEAVTITIRESRRCIRDFCEETEKAYFERMQRFFTVHSLTAPLTVLRKAKDRFQGLVTSLFVAKCENLLAWAAGPSVPEEAVFSADMANFISESRVLVDRLSVEFYVHFQDHLMACLKETSPELATSEGVGWIVDEFRIDIAHKANGLHDALLGVLNDSLKHRQDLADNSSKLVIHDLVDAFGRGLMEPLNDAYPILDCDMITPPLRSCFPRQFCAPVLTVLRDYVIGNEKYSKANKSILKSVKIYMGRNTDFAVDKLKLFFSHPRIRQYYIGSILYCLKTLSSEIRQENFIRKINKILRNTHGEGECVFTRKSWVMLNQSWVKTVRKNLGERQKYSKAVKEILDQYTYGPPMADSAPPEAYKDEKAYIGQPSSRGGGPVP